MRTPDLISTNDDLLDFEPAGLHTPTHTQSPQDLNSEDDVTEETVTSFPDDERQDERLSRPADSAVVHEGPEPDPFPTPLLGRTRGAPLTPSSA